MRRKKEKLLAALTSRERQVLHGAVKGQTYQEIADSLELGFETIKTHMAKIRNKLTCRTRTEVAVLAVRLGLV